MTSAVVYCEFLKKVSVGERTCLGSGQDSGSNEVMTRIRVKIRAECWVRRGAIINSQVDTMKKAI